MIAALGQQSTCSQHTSDLKHLWQQRSARVQDKSLSSIALASTGRAADSLRCHTEQAVARCHAALEHDLCHPAAPSGAAVEVAHALVPPEDTEALVTPQHPPIQAIRAMQAFNIPECSPCKLMKAFTSC